MAERVEFAGSGGQRLVGLLEVPRGEIKAAALFAHCFTCGKDNIAAARISRALRRRGIAVLRYDVTGLGESGGEFADATFSSDVADLSAAAAYLRTRDMAPSLLVGHSLGGAAVLASAGDIPEAAAVVTIGAPCDPAHVAHLFGDAVADLEQGEVAHVRLAGRDFQIRTSFLEDLKEQPQKRRIARLDRALLIMHSPQDAIVPVEDARQIFDAARHPKSFVSLDGADHLLSSRSDAEYVAEVLTSWAGRYLPDQILAGGDALDAGTDPLPPGEVRVRETGGGRFEQRVRAGRHTWTADEPKEAGGDDSGPNPYDFLLASLGTCTAMNVRMYARRKGYDLTGIEVVLRHDRVRGDDRDSCDYGDGCVDRIRREIVLEGPLSAQARADLMRISQRCPVHRSLERQVIVETVAGAPAG